MNNIFPLILFSAAMMVSVLITIALCHDTFVKKPADKCAKEHNVYRCEMVAVPVKGEGI